MRLAGACLIGVACAAAPAPAQITDAFVAVIERRCLECHAGSRASGGLDLQPWVDAAPSELSRLLEGDPTTAGYVLDRVRSGEMPPPDEREELAEAERALLIEGLETLLGGRYRTDLAPRPLAPVVRRLTRYEVDATLRDVLGVEPCAARFLPPESVALGLDSVGSAQTLSPAEVPGILDLAAAVAQEAIRVEQPGQGRRVRLSGGDFDARGGARLNRNGVAAAPHQVPRAGRYRMHVALSADQAGDELARAAVLAGDRRLGEVEVPDENSLEPFISSFDLDLERAGPHQLGVEFLNDYFRRDEPDPDQRDRNLTLHWIDLEGPLDPLVPGPFQRELLERFGDGDDDRRLELVVEHLCTRLWRRPPDRRDLRALVRLSAAESSFEGRVQLALEAIVASPRFLLRLETAPEDAGADDGDSEREYALDGYQLATRLSYFLWSSAPDEALLEAAASGELSSDEGLLGQARRLLEDPRARALAENFAAQWLGLAALDERDPISLPEDLGRSMTGETVRCFERVLGEDLPLLELLRADWSFVDARLAELYGLKVRPEDGTFALVDLGSTSRRGLLGHASILTVTSDPGRTSPVLRGRWVLDTLLGSPPPPAPPGVPPLEASGSAEDPLDLRASLARHRSDPACATCHAAIDPLGFALEGFGPRGARRVDAAGLDLSGELPDGRRFEGLRGLVEVLAADVRFVRNLLEKLLIHALGRPLEAADRAFVARTLARFDLEQVTLSDLLLAIVLDPSFRRSTTIVDGAR
jgi:mono/diheme cytochrome c family protein